MLTFCIDEIVAKTAPVARFVDRSHMFIAVCDAIRAAKTAQGGLDVVATVEEEFSVVAGESRYVVAADEGDIPDKVQPITVSCYSAQQSS
jgi:hypothetical protein